MFTSTKDIPPKIQYLIKFVSQKAHANALLNGDLFMHSAEYYHHFETEGQGDKGEASIFSGICIYQGAEYPIYCMSIVYLDDIKYNQIPINNRIISDFHCKNGYAVVINYSLFQQKIQSLETYGAPHFEHPIEYGNPTFTLSAKWFKSRSLANIFVKRTYFKYQKEYRIVVCNPLPPRIEKGVFEGTEVDFAYCDTSRTYHIPGGLHDCATIYSIANLQSDLDNSYITL